MKKVNFIQGDACNLKPQFTDYDFILAANLIDRLYSPAKFLASIHERLKLGGVLMLTSPYGRDGRVEVAIDVDDGVWIGGRVQPVIRGSVDWPSPLERNSTR